MQISVDSNIDEIVKAFSPSKVRKVITAATVPALNRGITAARRDAVDQVARLNGMKKGFVRRQIVRVSRRYDTAKKTRLQSKIFGVLSDVDLTELGNPRQIKMGVAVGRKRRYPGSFVSKMPNGHRNAYHRKGKARLPIKKTKHPLDSGTEKTISRAVSTTGEKVFKKRFFHELKRRLRRLK